MTFLPKFLLSFLVLGILGTLSLDQWEIRPQPSASPSSRFYVLHDWEHTYSQDKSTAPLPAVEISDIMLKTMGILKESASWPGVLMGNLFSRPHATALFIVDGLSTESSLDSLSDQSYHVDQTGLTGCAGEDVSMMFKTDNIAHHLSNLFDGKTQTRSVSTCEKAALAASSDGSYTSQEQLNSVMELLQKDGKFLSQFGLSSVTDRFDLSSKVDATFVAELVMTKQAVEQLKDLKTYVNDGAPDVFIFTFSALRSLEEKYGAGSSKMKVATTLLKDTIKQASDSLIALYDGKILVQALVLEWEYPEVGNHSSDLLAAYQVLQPHLHGQSLEEFVSHLPKVQINKDVADDPYMCSELKAVLGLSFKATCPEFEYQTERELREAPLPQLDLLNVTLGGIVEERSNIFAPIFLISLFITISMGLAVYAVSWMMWTMDPGRDSIIYRQVSDPTAEGMRMQ